ncbi:YdcH family protein [Parvibium lacunae]|uniref:YdcH family protein n=1 Tax=Parvibium lacunae TaxID=1888893 RepID=UPI001EFDF084|nr:YdcH family protein [Parvibium lacunae]
MDIELIKKRIVELKVEHQDLDTAIDRLSETPGHDELQLRRLKKHRLQLRDEISYWEIQLEPDILA